MSIAKTKFDALPDLVDEDQFEAWQDCILNIVEQFSLTPTQYEEIEGRYSTIAEIFLNACNAALDGAHFFTQGSFLTRTVIKPPSGGEIDVDAVVWLPNRQRLDAGQVFDAVHEELKDRVRTERGVEPKNRCTRVLYADERPKFHLDVTAAVNAFGNDGEKGEGKLVVPDREAIGARQGSGWKSSAPKAYAGWVDESSKFKVTLVLESRAIAMKAMDSATGTREPLPSKAQLDRFDALRATIKLLKFHREKFFAERSDEKFKPISVLLTTLACKAYRSVATRSVGMSMTAMEAIIAIVDELPNHFDAPMPAARWRLLNPVFETENFAERWNDAKDGELREAAFQEWHAQVRMDIRLGLKAFDSKKQFTESVVAAFGGHGTQTILDDAMNSALSGRGAVMGLSLEAIQEARQPAAVDRMFGVNRDRPRQEPAPLKRLG